MYGDQPASEDLLGRKPFARRVADLVRTWSGEKSLVVGIYGAWGSGKSTLVKFFRERLDELPDNERPLVVPFNPWEWNAQQGVMEAFFAELSASIKRSQPKASKLPQKLLNYSAALSLGATIAKSAQTILSVTKPHWAPVAAASAMALESSAENVKTASEYANDRTLSALKTELSGLLSRLKTNVVVVMDDVDRLTSREIGDLFQLIKVNADFPRIVYLVVCDPNVVEASLNDVVAGNKGAEFLEKIVQAGFHMPRLLPNQRERWLTSGVREILRRYGIEEQLDVVRWEDSYDEQLERYFNTPREIVRYLDSLEFVIADLATHWPVDFDVVDFLLLEVLRMYERELYEQFAGNKEKLTGRHYFLKPEDRAAYLQGLMNVVPTTRRHSAELMVRSIFPGFGTVDYRTPFRSRTSPVSDFDTFDRYFFFGVPASELTSDALKRILEDRADSDLFLAHLREARENSSLPALLNRLTDERLYDEKLSSTAAPSYLRALSVFSNEIDPEEASYRHPAHGQLRSLAWSALSAMNNEDRDGEFLGLFREGAPLVGALLLSSDRRNALPVSAAARKAARVLFAGWAAANTDTILTSPGAAWLISTWWDVDRANARHFLDHVLQSPDLAIRLVTAFSRHGLSDVHRPKKRRTELQIEWEALVGVVDIQKLQKALQPVDELKLDSRARKALREFRKEAKTHGRRVRAKRHRTKKGSADA